MFYKLRPHHLSIKRSTVLAATPIFFLVLLALWTIINTNVNSVDGKQLTNDTFGVVKQAHTNPNTQYQGVGMSQKGTILSFVDKYDDPELDESTPQSSNERCFSISEDTPLRLPEQNQWN